jgi:hypothetical protein
MAEKLAEKQSRSRVLILALGAAAILIVFLWQGRGQDSGMVWLKQKIMPVSSRQQQKPAVAITPLQIEEKVDLPPVKDEVKDLNDRGVDLVLQKQ